MMLMISTLINNFTNTKPLILFDFEGEQTKYLVISRYKNAVVLLKKAVIHNKDLQSVLKPILKFSSAVDCCILLPDKYVIRKSIEIHHKLSKSELKNLVHLNIQQYFQSQQDEPVYDYELLNPQTVNVVRIIATQKKILSEYTQRFNSYGLRVKVIDVESLVLERLFNSFLPISQVYIGFLVRSQHVLQVLVVNGLVKIVRETSAMYSSKLPLHVLASLQQFYRLCCEHEQYVSKVILCGDNDELQTIMQFFAELGVACEVLNLVSLAHAKKFCNETSELTNEYLLCYGLLLRWL